MRDVYKEQAAGQMEGSSSPASALQPYVSEALLSRLWQERAARHNHFVTSRGHKIKVLYPGRHNRSSGPDFKDALFYQEGLGLVRGGRGAASIHTGLGGSRPP
ncbi:MAG: DUF2851 family protein [SAR202 cluster bacterium]|nr:DUF2851 family protein [SAR202 cluster bacterium]